MLRVDAAIGRLRRAAWFKLGYGVALVACALVALAAPRTPADAQARAGVEWPQHWDERELRPLALGDVEQRFAARFPGTLARLTDGERQFVMRRVEHPTRMLHPAADCYRGSGWRLELARLERDDESRDWRCFEAIRDGERIRVCERITDAAGRAFTDTSDWFWSALLGQSRGPWLAVTTAQSL